MSAVRDLRRNARELRRLAWPETTLYLIGYANEIVVVAVVAVLGDVDLAAYRLLDTVTTVIYAIFAAASSGVTIELARDLGAGGRPAAGPVVRSGVLLGVLLAAPVWLPPLAVPRLFVSLFTSDAAVIDSAGSVAPIAVLGIMPMVVTLVLGGVLRAHRRNIWLMIASVVADVVALVPLAWLLGLHAGLGLRGVFLAWTAFALVNALLVAARFRPLLRATATSF